MSAKYEKEKKQILEIKNLKSQLDEAKGNVEKFEREYDQMCIRDSIEGTLNFFAIDEAPSTNTSAPFISNANPIIKIKNDKNIPP